ncbi:hypothetical protein T4D_3118 [Trichinella pseudospiralis]|uniref:Uncharacterized protein n=1 Tax=Trichinella pseudospiralis TaxID=6337 RepID=A0A0V1G034_TRIPS|nr:hypothetical protein T4D_3118 [Trichinella pseudospiralis]
MSHCSGLHFIVEKWKKIGKTMPKLEKYIEWDFFLEKEVYFGENIFAKCFHCGRDAWKIYGWLTS